MQRIDENTYIDDTLVTCAEYQLFIDEMREQGKYYQPDHWLEMQFPHGQANTPLLGMRFSDAIAFCQWLSARNTGEWQFRLPTLVEARSYPLYVDNNRNVGYWVVATPEQSKFFVLASHNKSTLQTREVFNDLRENHAVDFDSMFDRARSINSDAVMSIDPYNETDIVKARALYRGLDRDIRDLSRVRSNSQARDFSSELALAYARTLYRGLNSDNNRANELSQENIRLRARQRTREIDISDSFVRILDRASFRIAELAHIIEITYGLMNDLVDENTRTNDYKIVSDLHIDLLILSERIAGRINPIEGIRIVKERQPTSLLGRITKK